MSNSGPSESPMPNINFIHIRGWKVQASLDGTYLYVQRVGKPGDIHIKAEDEGFVVDVWNEDREIPEVMATLCCEYNDLTVGEHEDSITLPHWRVTLYENPITLGTQVVLFECWATDNLHAQEQALAKWPDGQIIQYEVID